MLTGNSNNTPSVIQTNNGWAVIINGKIIKDGMTNDKAWQHADALSPIDRSMEQKRSDISKAIGQW